jgi:hypothetical protein
MSGADGNSIDRRRGNDFAVWLAAAILGSLGWELPFALSGHTAKGGRWSLDVVIGALALLALGLVAGLLRPQRPWRWALASVSLLPVMYAVRLFLLAPALTGDAPGSSLNGVFVYFLMWLLQIATVLVPALPAFLGAYAGSYARRRALHPRRAVRSAVAWGLAFGLGLLAAIPYLVNAHRAVDPLPLWATPALLLFAALGLGAYRPAMAARWAAAIGSALPCWVIVNIVVDSASDATSHNLFPIEIVLAVVASFPASFLGAYAGRLVRAN